MNISIIQVDEDSYPHKYTLLISHPEMSYTLEQMKEACIEYLANRWGVNYQTIIRKNVTTTMWKSTLIYIERFLKPVEQKL